MILGSVPPGPASEARNASWKASTAGGAPAAGASRATSSGTPGGRLKESAKVSPLVKPHTSVITSETARVPPETSRQASAPSPAATRFFANQTIIETKK